jgi:probable HAF family extracellular repeat protein
VRPHGKVLVTGGDSGPFSSGILASAELYDPDTGLFSPTGSMSAGRWLHTATLLPAYELRPHGKVLVAEGDKGVSVPGIGAALASAELYALPPTYTITDLGTLGGTFSQALIVSNNGLIGGLASRADDTQHAALWYNGQIGDISTPGLGGPNSGVFGVNEMGQVSGQAESSAPDPNNENFCGYGTGLKCLAFLWQNGVMTALPTLGGSNGTVGPINNRGQVIGVAENSTKDKNCASPQVLDFEAVIWGPNPGEIRQLPPLPGNSVGMALWINDNGQAVGASGSCANSALPPIAFGPHAVLWEKDGSVTDLGNLGAAVVNIGLYINNQGQVVGASSLTADSTPFVSTHAFLWTKETGMQDLGTLPGAVASAGLGINDRGEVVGVSDDASGNARAFLRQNGVMTDLNTLIPANSPLVPVLASTINSRGEIVGFGMTSTGDVHGFLATPSSGQDTSESLSSAAQDVTSPMLLPKDVRNLLQQRLRFGRFGPRLMGPR